MPRPSVEGYGFVELGDGRRIYVHHTSFGGGSLMAGLELEASLPFQQDRNGDGNYGYEHQQRFLSIFKKTRCRRRRGRCPF